MTEVLLDAQVETHLAWFFLHDSDDRYGVAARRGGVRHPVVETADGVAVLLGDEDGHDEVPVRVRVLREPAEVDGDPAFDKILFLYGTGLVVEDGFPSSPHLLELGGPGRVRVRLFLDTEVSPPAVTSSSATSSRTGACCRRSRCCNCCASGTRASSAVQVLPLGSKAWRFATSVTAD